MLGQQVEVYLNLNKTKAGDTYAVYSIRGKVDGKKKVLGYAYNVVLSDCTFHVSEKTRQRVIRNKERCIHAWVKGTLVSYSDDRGPVPSHVSAVSYNP